MIILDKHFFYAHLISFSVVGFLLLLSGSLNLNNYAGWFTLFFGSLGVAVFLIGILQYGSKYLLNNFDCGRLAPLLIKLAYSLNNTKRVR